MVSVFIKKQKQYKERKQNELNRLFIKDHTECFRNTDGITLLYVECM